MFQLNIADTAILLLAASTIGVVDAFWFHHHRFRLYRQPASPPARQRRRGSRPPRQLRHLRRLSRIAAQRRGRRILPRAGARPIRRATGPHRRGRPARTRSRAPLGGLPALEYLFHVLVTFGIGAAAATFWWTTRTDTAKPLHGIERTQLIISAAFTTVLLAVESAPYLRARLSRHPSRVVIPGN